MLDQASKKRIDDLRNILVGKVPDPKSQVEQITISLIFKFMNDMDEESMAIGGVASFFVKEFEKYNWKSIFNPRLGGSDLVILYGEAIERMSHNPYLPQLFRDIFKNAYIPYKDPETLRLFLKTINEFEYTHSEKLGDAFEYLLSFMGSQGDAGMFRTPRHLIDFIVEIVSPKKNESILDPSSGTAGFLISAYKYVLNTNMSKSPGDLLTSDERKELTKNINGYDISPDMVRLGLANLYLHNFTEPKIYEYDTLSSEDRWNEYFDVILANPPFMTPTGGIRPHQRFGVKSNRSEVLFVDYILDHLKPNGRAGIIVPEGVVETQNLSFESIRKKLIDNGLIGVISLPAGIFKPYSGVKTNLLLIDKNISQNKNEIFFAAIKNDGYELGDQRRVIKKNDLPIIKDKIKNYQINTNAESDEDFHLISKEVILKTKGSPLVLRRYIKNHQNEESSQLYKLTDLFSPLSIKSKIKTQNFLESGKYPIVDQSEELISGYTNDINTLIEVEAPLIIFGDHTRVVKFVNFPFAMGADGIKVLKPKTDLIEAKFLYYIFKYAPIPNLGYSRHYKELDFLNIKIPDKDKQLFHIMKFDSYKNIIDGCKMVINNFNPFINIDPSWEVLSFSALLEKGLIKIQNGIGLSSYEDKGDMPYVKVSDMNIPENIPEIKTSSKFLSSHNFDKSKILEIDTIIFPKVGAAIQTNKKRITSVPCIIDGNTASITVIDKNKINPYYLFYFLQNIKLIDYSRDSGYPSLNRDDIGRIELSLPQISVQDEIVSHIKLEYSLIDTNKKLIGINEEKLRNEVTLLWENI